MSDASSRFNAVIESVQDDQVVVSGPGNAYRIRLQWAGDGTPEAGRLPAEIHAHALRVHPASAGGRFIEPVNGAPRIVAGTIEAVDTQAAIVALRSVVPMRVALADRGDLEHCTVGATVNFHVQSDSSLHPA